LKSWFSVFNFTKTIKQAGDGISHVHLQCVRVKKIPPLRFSDIFSQTDVNFFIPFYAPVIRSFLHQTTNFYPIISNFDEVIPYYARPPCEFLHFTRSLTSKFAYWANDVTVDVMSYLTCLLTL